MRRVLAAVLLTLAACATGRVHARDVADAFEGEYAAVRHRLPTYDALAPCPLDGSGDAMAQTIRMARSYLGRRSSEGLSPRYVRALLACAHLIRGEIGEAREVAAGLRADLRHLLAYENAFADATVYAVGACTVVEARIALRALFLGETSPAAYLERYAGYVAVDLPPPESPDRAPALAREAAALRQRCVPALEGDPRAMEEVAAGRKEIVRILGEQIYNDAAALLAALPETPRGKAPAETQFLASLDATLLIIHALVMQDLLPVELNPAQKLWQSEQAQSLYGRAWRQTEAVLVEGRSSVRPDHEALRQRLGEAQRDVLYAIAQR